MRYEFFPDRLKQARDAKDWSQTQLGRKMKCATQQISHWELGLRTPQCSDHSQACNPSWEGTWLFFCADIGRHAVRKRRGLAKLKP